MTTKPTPKVDRRLRESRAVKPSPPPTPKRGRPSVIRGKGATIGIRLTDALRVRLLAYAADRQLSLSDAVAMLLERGLSTIR